MAKINFKVTNGTIELLNEKKRKISTIKLVSFPVHKKASYLKLLILYFLKNNRSINYLPSGIHHYLFF